MSYLLDTCVLSEYTKKNPNSQVIDWWLDEQKEAVLFISTLSIAEIRKGIIRITDSQPDRANKLRIWVAPRNNSASLFGYPVILPKLWPKVDIVAKFSCYMQAIAIRQYPETIFNKVIIISM